MTAKKTAKARPAAPRPEMEPISSTPPWTTEERLLRIEAMGLRINAYILYMTKVGTLNGVSAEAKDRVVVAFYERMVQFEKQLSKIQEEFQLE